MSSGNSDFILASPPKLSDASPSFLQGAQNITQLLKSTDTMMQGLIGELFLLSQLAAYASALEQFQARMETSGECIKAALTRTSNNLDETARAFLGLDGRLAGLFHQIESFLTSPRPRPQPPTIPIPGLQPGGNPFPGISPQPIPIPGLQPGKNPFSGLFPQPGKNPFPGISPIPIPGLQPGKNPFPGISSQPPSGFHPGSSPFPSISPFPHVGLGGISISLP